MSDPRRNLPQPLHPDLEERVARLGGHRVVVGVGARPHDAQDLADELGLECVAIVLHGWKMHRVADARQWSAVAFAQNAAKRAR